MQADVNEVRADGQVRRRKAYSEEFKQRVVALTLEPGGVGVAGGAPARTELRLHGAVGLPTMAGVMRLLERSR